MNRKTTLSPLKPYRFKVFAAPLLKLFECVCELAVPFLVSAIIDQGLTLGGAHYHDASFILPLCGVVFLLAVLGFGLTMVAQYLASDTCTRYAKDLRLEIYSHIQSLTPAELESYGKSKALTLLSSDSFSAQNGVQWFMRLLVRAPFMVFGSIVASFIINWRAALVVVGALGLSALVIFLVVKFTPGRYGRLQHQLDVISYKGEDAIVGTRVIRAFHLQEKEKEGFQEESEKYRRLALSLSKINAAINPLTFGFVNLAIVLILYLGSYQAGSSFLTTGAIVALLSFLTQSLNALMQFTRLVTSLSKALASKKRIDEFLALEPKIKDGEREEEAEVSIGDTLFELKNVDLGFGGEELALKGINMAIRKGEKIGIIGGTGSGKSTIVALLERFLDPTSGTVMFKGHDAKESKLASIRGQIALVSQKPQLFKGTIESNLTLGEPKTKEEIDEALRDALAYDFVHEKEGGLSHAVEEGGSNFSGGQKQRLLIARALLAKRDVLILDDATSALDYRSDAQVRENINKRKDLTLVIVSQRATSIRGCDRIYVLDKGEIVGVGKHEEILKSCEVYRQIYEAQVKRK